MKPCADELPIAFLIYGSPPGITGCYLGGLFYPAHRLGRQSQLEFGGQMRSGVSYGFDPVGEEHSVRILFYVLPGFRVLGNKILHVANEKRHVSQQGSVSSLSHH